MKNYLRQVNRRNTNCYKWDSIEDNKDLIPLWVADMEFQAPKEIVDAVVKRAKHPAYGYVRVPDEYYFAVCNWFNEVHSWRFLKTDVIYTTGVIPALSAVIKAVTKPNDNVLIFTPVYNHFYSSIKNNGCNIISCPLKRDENLVYHIDFDDYRTQLLFSYRSICSEIRKKQFNIERFRLLTENQDKFDVLLGTKLGICDLNTYKQLVEENLNESDQKFTFLHLTYPFLPVYASGVTSNYFIDEENNSYMEHIAIEPMLDSIFINIIPQHESLEIIIGYSNDHIHKNLLNYIKSWENLSWEKLQQQIWNLFEHSIETWGISPSFYDKMPQVWKYGYTSLNFNT